MCIYVHMYVYSTDFGMCVYDSASNFFSPLPVIS